MSADRPPALSRRTKLLVGVVLAVTLVYSFVIAGQILLWFLFAGLVAGVYVAWLLVLAAFRLVEAVERLAETREAETAGDARPSGVEVDDADRATEPESDDEGVSVEGRGVRDDDERTGSADDG
ncbi:ATP synthase subunit I [Halobellus rufus]|uniref:ATP synthase subunit I n=1 Tax=Halobellus rufus TaxID=1448860 RepID=UPI0006793F7C|nr:ATP synthase subunit I [Halobellus rufus]